MTMITFPCRLRKVASARELIQKSYLSHESLKIDHGQQFCRLSSRQRRLLDQVRDSKKLVERKRNKSTYSRFANISNTKFNACDSFQYDHHKLLTPPDLRRCESGTTKRSRCRQIPQERPNYSPSVVQCSQYSYRIDSGRDKLPSDEFSSFSGMKVGNRTTGIMQSMNASALLDPLRFCKGSTKLRQCMKHGPTSISGNDAARRLLRGRKEFLIAARALNDAPIVLDGHGVPPALFQHCVDMADALLHYYGPDVVECSFNNYRSKKTSMSKEPPYVRVRRRNAKNSCLPSPSLAAIGRTCERNCDENEDINDEIDWDHNLTLYLTVMERLAKNLGQVVGVAAFKKDNPKNKLHSSREEKNNIDFHNDDSDDYDLASLQFPSNQPLWNVDIFRGTYFDFKPILNEVDSMDNDDSDRIHPFPVVEFFQPESPDSSGHVLIRLQGYPVANEEFERVWTRERQPVTLVFDACINPGNDYY